MNHVTWPRPFQGRFVIRRLGLAMFIPHIKFHMSIRLPATKKWRATPILKFSFWATLWDLGVTYTVHLWLAGKRVSTSY